MAAFTKFFSFVEDLAEKVHNLGADQLAFALTAVGQAPTTATTQLSDLTVISYTNASTRNITTSTSAQTSGTYKLVLTDHVLTAGGGAIAAFRYISIVNDTSTNDRGIGWYDYASALTLNDGENLTTDFDASGGFCTLT